MFTDRLFLKNDLEAGLSSEDLPEALSWVEETLPRVSDFSFSPALRRSPRYHAVRQILHQAWQQLGNHQVLVSFSRVALFCLDVLHKCPLLTEYDTPDFEAIKNHPEGRRKVIQFLVETKSELPSQGHPRPTELATSSSLERRRGMAC